MTRNLFPGVIAVLICGCASARTIHGVSGPGPVPATIIFGAETLGGFGGYQMPSGVTMATLLNASGNMSTDFLIDSTGDLVPSGSYGGVAPLYNGPYVATLSSGAITNISIAPNTSTVKSHYGFAAASNPDTSSSFQLASVLGSASNIHLGDTVVIRGGTGAAGPTPALNPLNLTTTASGSEGRYFIAPPETSSGVTYIGLGRIRIQCETANTAIDTNGNPIQGGNCDVGGLVINSAYDVSIPYDFYNIHFYDNIAPLGPTATPNGFLLGYKSLGFGVNAYNNRFEYGAAFNPNYVRANTANMIEDLAMRLGTADHNHFIGGWVGIFGTSPAGGSTTLDVATPWYITNNVFEHIVSDGVDYQTNSSGAVATSNFFFNFQDGVQNPALGDQFIVGVKTYTFVASPVNDGDVPLAPNIDQTASNVICTIMNGGSGCIVGANYPAAETTDANIASANKTIGSASSQVSITFANSSPLTLATAYAPALRAASTSLKWGGSASATVAAGGTVALTFNPPHSDTFQWVGSNKPGLIIHNGPTDYNISIRGYSPPNVGIRQFYLSNLNTYCCMGGVGSNGVEVKNNISSLNAVNQVYLSRNYSPNVLSNTLLTDVGSSVYAPTDPSYDTLSNPGWYNVVYKATYFFFTDGGGGLNFTNNLGNVVLTGGQTTQGSVPSYSFTATYNGTTSLTVTSGAIPVPMTTLTAGPGILATTPPYVKSVSGSVVVLSAAIAGSGSASFTTGDPTVGLPAGAVSVTGNESVNWSGATPPTDGGFMTAVYKTFLPNYPTGGVLTTNRADTIRAFTPSVGSTFVGSITSILSPYRITVTNGPIPPINTPINGPNIPSGDAVIAVSGSTLTLLLAPTATGSALTFSTGAMNPDGTYNGALFPNGCWNDNSVYNPATICASAN